MAMPGDDQGSPVPAHEESSPSKTPNTTLRIQTHHLHTPHKGAFTEQSSPILASLPLPPSSTPPPSNGNSSLPQSSSSSSRHRWPIPPGLRNWSQVLKASHNLAHPPQPQTQPNTQPLRFLATTEFSQDQQGRAEETTPTAVAVAVSEAPTQVINRHYRPPRPPSDTRLQHRASSSRTKRSKSRNKGNQRKHSKSLPKSKKPISATGNTASPSVSGQFFQRLYHALSSIFTHRQRRGHRRSSPQAPTPAPIFDTSAATATTSGSRKNRHPAAPAEFHSPVSPTQKQTLPDNTLAEPTSQPQATPVSAPVYSSVPAAPSFLSTNDHLFDRRDSLDSNLSFLEVASSCTSLSDHLYASDSTPPSIPSSSIHNKGKARHQDNLPSPLQQHPLHLNQEKTLPALPISPACPPNSKTNNNNLTSKMMKIIDKIKNHHHQSEHDAPAPVEQKPSKPAGPRLHPDLIALYDISDKVLGVGTFATVKEIRCKETGKKFALKIILRKTLQGKGTMLETEISVLSKVRHQNCVSLLEMFETEDAVYLVTDLAEGGELFDQLLQKGYYTEGDAARLVRDVLLGVEYLHSMDIVHRDLKPENLLFKDKSENATLMITDFGLSKVLTGDNHVLMTACGTPGYVAPEVLQQTGHGKPVDMWSIGVIAYTLLVGFMPFYGEDQGALFESIMSGEYEYEEEYWADISPLAKAFIDSLLVTDPEGRPTASHALDHPWFRAVLEQDMITPVSPADSVNLLPGFRKNFNARRMFKRAVRAVGILRKIQGAGSSSSFDSSSSLSSGRMSGEFTEESRSNAAVAPTTSSGGSSRPHSLNAALSFHDVVQAAALAHKGLAGVTEHDDEDVSETMNKLSVKDP